MNFKTPTAVESVVLQLVYGEWQRAGNRAAINKLFNGFPPYSPEEQTQNNINVNINDLTATNIAMTARGQFTNALVTPDPLVNIEIDYGPVWKRREWAMKIQQAFNAMLKNSLMYNEEQESTFANVVLHGIGPSMWTDKELWLPKPKMVEDVLVPGRTLRSMENCQMFAVREQYTGMQLRRMTQGRNRDPGWNMPLVKQMIEWVDAETHRLMGNYWPETWQPEQWAERWKEDSGMFTGDDIPTVDTFHFYFWNDNQKVSGWNKRVILDTWGNPGLSASTAAFSTSRSSGKYGKVKMGPRSQFLYAPGDRKFGDNLSEIMHWQFGDASAVAPFRYHSVRSLGFLLYAVCHLQNRMKCRVSEAAFESLLQYFRVTNPEDAERATKVDLINRGVIPDGINFMPQAERWQTNQAMPEMALAQYQETIGRNSAAFTQGPETRSEKDAKTATEVMAEVNSTSQLIGAMLGRAYNYEEFKDREILRRVCISGSKDVQVNKFRTDVLKAGVPVEALNPERLKATRNRVIGNGNQMLQIATADKMMSQYEKLDPTAQKEMLRLFFAANSRDYDLANRLVPEITTVSPTVNAAQNDAATLLAGLPVTPRKGISEEEYIGTLLHSMVSKIQQLEQGGGMATAPEITGLNNMAQAVTAHLKFFAEDKGNKAKAKQFGDDLGKLMNLVKAYAQRLAEQQKKQNGNGQIDPKDLAKAQAIIIQAKTKAKIGSDAAAQRTAQKEVQFQQKVRQDAIKHRVDIAKTDLESAANIRRGRSSPIPEE